MSDNRTVEQRFFQKVARPAGDNQCTVWLASRDKDGYGKFCVEGETIRAHRYALEHKLGRNLGRDEVAMHICDNPPCVRPDHLIAGTIADNNLDRVAKGRWTGGRKPFKLTDAEVREIRAKRQNGVLLRVLALEYGVADTTISRIFRGSKRANVK